LPKNPSPLFGKVTASEETSNDGTSKLDPIYDEDEEDDEEECYRKAWFKTSLKQCDN